jgi:hypothetical protein
VSGDAWRYAPNYSDPEAAKLLMQAALTAYATIVFAQRCSPSDFVTVPDWHAVERELHQALVAVGHPAGETKET